MTQFKQSWFHAMESLKMVRLDWHEVAAQRADHNSVANVLAEVGGMLKGSGFREMGGGCIQAKRRRHPQQAIHRQSNLQYDGDRVMHWLHYQVMCRRGGTVRGYDCRQCMVSATALSTNHVRRPPSC